MMSIKYQPRISPPPPEFVEPNPSDSFIWWLFRRRCIMCHEPATEINEIEPRSRSKKNLFEWTNRVTLCQSCHWEYHKKGTNAVNIAKMKQKREEFLVQFGREEYLSVEMVNE